MSMGPSASSGQASLRLVVIPSRQAVVIPSRQAVVIPSRQAVVIPSRQARDLHHPGRGFCRESEDPSLRSG